ncbi:MAG: type II toxin-antitoxin system VapC family toxin [Deltaproteobacteria bacterium]|nr:type II toxin-antitoxin system VapC family toxin [Deltaproteobacteria bacterium]
MNIFLDTSALVAAFVDTHERHKFSHAWLNKALHHVPLMGVHSIAEMFNSFCRIYSKVDYPVDEVRDVFENELKKFKKIVLEEEEYREVICKLLHVGLKGSLIYDALLYQAACKAKADVLITLNAKDFLRFDWGKVKIVSPE